jgi:hypothetical protein
MQTKFENFANEMKNVENYFGKNLSAEQMLAYHNACGHIPLMPLAEILKNIMKAKRPTPGQMPTPDDINAGWQCWKSAHPKQMVSERTPCEECHSTGFIWYRKFVESLGQTNEYCARCVLCENWQEQVHASVMSATTRDQVERLGYVVVKL